MPSFIVTPKPTPVGFIAKTAQAASHAESFLIADFGSIPPEINSARMYAGPGADPLLKAAATWDALGADLYAAAESHHAVLSQLAADSWRGPASAMMIAGTMPFLHWLHDSAALAARTARHARDAVAAYEAARAMTAHPSVVAVNRAQLATLSAANAIGVKAHEISAVEATYREMWAQDSTAMYLYADSSAKAAAMVPFLPPPGAAGDIAHTAQSSATVQALKRLASPARLGAPSTSMLTGAHESLQPIGAAGPVTVGRVATIASVGKAATIGVLSAPRSWITAASVTGLPVATCGVGSVAPIAATQVVPMMPAARAAGRDVCGRVPASRAGARTVVRMQALGR